MIETDSVADVEEARMRARTASVATRAGAVVLAAAAVAVVVATALDDGGDTDDAAAKPSAPPRITGPVVTARPSDPSYEKPTIEPAKAKASLKKLVGKWVLANGKKGYFLFRADGSGRWVVLGRKLWSGRATPRGSHTFDLSWKGSEGATYWRVELTDGGKKLFFEGTRQTYRKAT